MQTQLFKTKEEQEEFNQAIKDCFVYDFNSEEAQAYIKNKIGVEVPLDKIPRIIDDFKYENLKSKLSSYNNDNSDDNIYDHFEKIQVIKFIRKELRQLCDKNTENPMLQVEYISKMRESTILLTNLYFRIFGFSLKIPF
jgi:hypothetical protein